MISKIRSTRTGARPSDGSSRSRSFGRAMSARPIAHICCSPPESVPAFCAGARRDAGRARTRARCPPRIPALSRRWNAPISRFSSTVMRANSRRPSGDWQIPSRTISCGGWPTMSLPLNRIVPRLGRLMPWIERSVVDLPAPFAPIRVTISPSFTVERDALERLDRAVERVDVVELEQRRRRCQLIASPALVAVRRRAGAQVGLDHALVRPGSRPACPRRSSGRSRAP